jgi:cytochrome b subunit of formate dehydrogenase
MRFVIVFMLAATADLLWAGYISAVSGKQAVRAAAWSMSIAVVSGVIAIHYVHAPVLLVSLASGSFVGTYLSVVSENGRAIRHPSWLIRSVTRERSRCSAVRKSALPRPGVVSLRGQSNAQTQQSAANR